MPPFLDLLSSLFKKFTVDRGHAERSECQSVLKRLHTQAILKAALRGCFAGGKWRKKTRRDSGWRAGGGQEEVSRRTAIIIY